MKNDYYHLQNKERRFDPLLIRPTPPDSGLDPLLTRFTITRDSVAL
jgi:hypothetical protein